MVLVDPVIGRRWCPAQFRNPRDTGRRSTPCCAKRQPGFEPGTASIASVAIRRRFCYRRRTFDVIQPTALNDRVQRSLVDAVIPAEVDRAN